jgi:hypothetical protein
MKRETVHFACSAVAIEHEGERSAQIVDFVLRHAPRDGDAPPHLTFRLMDAGAGRLALHRNDTLVYHGDCSARAAEWLLGEVCHHLADRSRGGLLFHAAGLTWQGQGILVPGAVSAGKSTFAAWLTTLGCRYLTDELVYVPHGSDRMRAFVRPLNLKKPARQVLAGRFDFQPDDSCILCGPGFDLIAPSLLELGDQFAPVVSLMLFPQYQQDGEPSFRRLSGAQAGMSLMEALINARNLPGHGFAEIVRLARAVPAYGTRYSHFGQVGESMSKVLHDLTVRDGQRQSL